MFCINLKITFIMQQKRIPESELVLNPDGSVYHLHLKSEQIADKVILVGDPGRVSTVASLFDSVEFQIENREFVSATGVYRGERFTVLSTGIGTDNIDIVLNELDAAINVDPQTRIPNITRKSLAIVRIGTSGALHADIPVDSYLLSSYGLGLDGLLYYYKYKYTDNEQFIIDKLNNHLNWNPQLATPYIVEADAGLVELLGQDMMTGITATATGFYGPQGRRLTLDLENEQMHERFRSFEYQGLRITNFEMETSAIYGLGKLMGHRCCTCCAIIANRVTEKYSKDYHPTMEQLIRLVLDRLSGHVTN